MVRIPLVCLQFVLCWNIACQATMSQESTQPATNSIQRDSAPSGALHSTPDINSEHSEPVNRITEKQIELRLETVRSDEELDEKTKVELLKRYTAAQDSLKNTREAIKKTAEYKTEIEQAPTALADAKRTLAEPTGEPEVAVPPDATFDAIETLASKAQERYKSAQASLDRIEQEVQRRGERKGEIAKLTEEVSHRLAETRKLASSSATLEESQALLDARKVELETRETALKSQLALYKVEVARNDACAELLTLSRDIAKRVKTLREKEAALWQQVVATRRKRETERQAAEARRQVQNSHPALRSLAEQNAILAEQRKQLADSLARIGLQLASVNKETEKLGVQFQKAEQRVRRAVIRRPSV